MKSLLTFQSYRHRLQSWLYECQTRSRTQYLPGAFAYDQFKILYKEAFWKLPSRYQVTVCGWMTKLSLVNRSYCAYIRMGRPAKVLAGPFRGMLLHPVPTGGEFLPKFLGTYEMELHPHLAHICSLNFDILVDIGSAEGYYAVGLARCLKLKNVICFDGNPHAKRLLLRNANLNRVINYVSARRWCSVVDLEVSLSGSSKPLIICDCEGGEEELLNLDLVPSLRKAVILVEIHDKKVNGQISSTLQNRFTCTHEIRAVFSKARSVNDLPTGLNIDPADFPDLVDEGRTHQMQWFCMYPKA